MTTRADGAFAAIPREEFGFVRAALERLNVCQFSYIPPELMMTFYLNYTLFRYLAITPDIEF